MSFYKSLSILESKIQQKNIVLVTGNIDEIFSINKLDGNNNCLDKFISPIDYIENFAKKNKIKNIEFYSSNKGVVYLGDEKENTQIDNKEKTSKDDFDEDFLSDDSSNGIIPFDQYVNDLTNKLNSIDKSTTNHSSLFIVDCSEIFLDKALNGIQPASLAKLLTNFIYSNKNAPIKFVKNIKKLVLFSRNPKNIAESINANNVEYTEVHLLKPDYQEREDFFKKYSSHFDIKDTINNSNSQDFKDAISITEGLSFREILQFAKLNFASNENLTFKQLYNWSTFNKKDSEWEKIDMDKMSNIDSILKKRVIGQDDAINSLKVSLMRSFAGLSGITHSSTNKKPKGILFLAGPTGTGKTELAKALAEFVFEDESRLIRFDMSEYNHEHSDQRLIGAPPGYVGHESGGQLTNIVKEKPFSILLFDEIEKAHGKILDKFLQILEDGRLTSSKGEIIDFSETFIIFTSNIGTGEIANKNIKDNVEVSRAFISEIKKHFDETLKRPEILNRIGLKNIIPFNFISDKKIQYQIIESKMKRIISTIKEDKFIDINYDNNILTSMSDLIISKSDIKYGGRGLITELETVFIDELSSFIFENKKIIEEKKAVARYAKINMLFTNNKIKFNL